jgi:hypothetical protein
MTDQEIRALVREAITRHLGDGRRDGRGAEGPPSPGQPGAPPPWRAHPSFGRFLVTSGTDEEGACLIEPRVRCNHCGYCQSYGH